jgi:hypothetical protein
MSAGAWAEDWTTHDRQEQECDEIVNLFHERDSETALMRDNKTSEETTKDRVYTWTLVNDWQYGLTDDAGKEG